MEAEVAIQMEESISILRRRNECNVNTNINRSVQMGTRNSITKKDLCQNVRFENLFQQNNIAHIKVVLVLQ